MGASLKTIQITIPVTYSNPSLWAVSMHWGSFMNVCLLDVLYSVWYLQLIVLFSVVLSFSFCILYQNKKNEPTGLNLHWCLFEESCFQRVLWTSNHFTSFTVMNTFKTFDYITCEKISVQFFCMPKWICVKLLFLNIVWLWQVLGLGSVDLSKCLIPHKCVFIRETIEHIFIKSIKKDLKCVHCLSK